MNRTRTVAFLLSVSMVGLLSPALAQDNPGGQSDDPSRDEKKVTVEKSATGPNEQTATGEATWTKDGKTVTRQGSTTGPKGKTVTELKTITGTRKARPRPKP